MVKLILYLGDIIGKSEGANVCCWLTIRLSVLLEMQAILDDLPLNPRVWITAQCKLSRTTSMEHRFSGSIPTQIFRPMTTEVNDHMRPYKTCLVTCSS